jgi:hypothetical protein
MVRASYGNTSLAFLLAALACLTVADIAVSALDPWAEMARLGRGLLGPDLLSIEVWSVIWTVAFAVLGVGLGAVCGLALAIAYPAVALVRALAMVLRLDPRAILGPDPHPDLWAWAHDRPPRNRAALYRLFRQGLR